MLAVPPGRCWIGSAPGEPGHLSREAPRHEVSISGWLAVSQGAISFDDWALFARDAGLAMPDDCAWGRGRRPVIHVSWRDAQDYLTWLNHKAGLNVSSPGRYRLLSEAEWEYACRAGSEAAFAWGETISVQQANFNGRFGWPAGGEASLLERGIARLLGHPLWRRRSESVLAGQANAWGLCGMHGNVWEWVEDAYFPDYRGAPADGSTRAADGDSAMRGLRGGSWRSGPESLRSAARHAAVATVRACDIGFRIARSL